MPFLDYPRELFKLLKTQEIPVTDVQVGDVLFDNLNGHTVAHVVSEDEIESMSHGPRLGWLNFCRTAVGRDERCVTRRDTDTIQIIDRSCLRHLTGDTDSEQRPDK